MVSDKRESATLTLLASRSATVEQGISSIDNVLSSLTASALRDLHQTLKALGLTMENVRTLSPVFPSIPVGISPGGRQLTYVSCRLVATVDTNLATSRNC